MDALLNYSSSSEEDADSLYESALLVRSDPCDTMLDGMSNECLDFNAIPTAEVVNLDEDSNEDCMCFEPAVVVLNSSENLLQVDNDSNVENDQNSSSSVNNENETPGTFLIPGRRSYTIKTKLDVLKRLDENDNNVTKTAKQLKINESQLRRWRKLRSKFNTMKNGNEVTVRRRRLIRSDRNKFYPKLPETEKLLFEYIENRREKGLSVNQREIKFEAIKINDELQERSAFSASNGWINRFLNRHDLTLRTATSIGQKIPVNAKELAVNFLEFIKDYNEKNASNEIIYANMDEVPVWFDMPRNKTYNKKGAKNVPLKTTGNEKLRFTVVLASLSDGRKCKPMIIFKGLKNVPRCTFPSDVVVTVAEKGSTNKELMNEWNRKVWKFRPSALFSNLRNCNMKTLLVMDSHKAHLTDDLKKSYNRWYNTDLCIVPGGMTPLLQPADVSYNKSFKSIMKGLWSKWFTVESENNTRVRKASYSLVAEWVSEAWKQLDTQMVINSFKQCGVAKDAQTSEFHLRLRSLIETGTFLEDNEPSGISDDEEDEVQECIEELILNEDH
ncbi:pogo transposable element with KRAB domain-like protein [Leptotrombidium deliense]|uniref:Pogo transposable element with KRAB domain-like protein n=1 Tax=Leptotrombidium deliense TaxID=299467 RepID=A0A443S7Z8_9ACAR|nr:pogo transposable element with KRAB domain-like protein [Leptotrombidium deliense]